MGVAEAVLPWLCCAISLAAVVLVPLRLRDPHRLRDLQLDLNAAPRINVLLSLFLALCAVVLVFVGVWFLLSGYSFAWGLFPLAAAQLFLLGFFIYVARRPFPDFEAEAKGPVE